MNDEKGTDRLFILLYKDEKGNHKLPLGDNHFNHLELLNALENLPDGTPVLINCIQYIDVTTQILQEMKTRIIPGGINVN